ncbi:MAG: glutathione S-transferase family protein [Rudaea sp.]
MSLVLFTHPFSSYSQKVLIALYENATPFDYRVLDNAQAFAELEAVWPHKRFPVLLDDTVAVIESTIIIEHLALHHPGPVRLIPVDPQAALQVRWLDRLFDNYVMTPMQKIVGDRLRTGPDRDAFGVAESRTRLDTSYRWLDVWMQNRPWAAGSEFSMADCAAAPSLFYADWVHAIDPQFAHLRAYRQRLLQRASFARAVDEARPYRHLFPLGAPARD